MTTVNCIECAGPISVLDDVLVSELFECPDCGVELEVIQVSPLRLELAPEIEEDWGE